MYVTDRYYDRVYKWPDGSTSPSRTLSSGVKEPESLFVSSRGDIYIHNRADATITKWIETTNTTEFITKFCDVCSTIFIGINNVLYCSMPNRHQVVTKSLHSDTNMLTIVAGVGFEGSERHMLTEPRGIFVNTNLDLYVVDYGNGRIQRFPSGEINAVTIVHIPNDGTFYSFPQNIVLDANDQIYIQMYSIGSIYRLGPIGYQCIAYCDEPTDGIPESLSAPQNIVFDSSGNIYTVDPDNTYIQKTLLSKNTCGQYY